MTGRQMTRRISWVWFCGAAAATAVALSGCGGPKPIAAGNTGTGAASGTGSSIDLTRNGKTNVSTGTSTDTSITRGLTDAPWPPVGYVNVTNVSYGAYALGPQLTATSPLAGAGGTGGNGAGAGANCSGLYGVVRDFEMGTTSGGHPDFQSPPVQDDRGIVTATLGSDGKPVYAHQGGTTPTTNGQAEYDKWYNDVPGVNMTYLLGLHFVPNGKVVTFAASINNQGVPDSSYFPLDGQGFGNQGENHNFSFTTEIHTSFTYNGGETFTFQGDDDVWVYINNQRVIDLGGIHAQETQTVNLDAQAGTLGITVGNVYSLAVFNAERHTTQSNFRIDTTMAFTNCGEVDGIIIY